MKTNHYGQVVKNPDGSTTEETAITELAEETPLSPSDATACSFPPYDEWRKLPPDEAARILAKHRNLDSEQEGLIAAILEHFREENAKEHTTPRNEA